VRLGETKATLSKGYFHTTNNRMEAMAVIATLEEFGPGKHFEIYIDSQFVIDVATKWARSWRRTGWLTRAQQPVKNRDLWEILLELLAVNKVKFIKVPAHSGIPDNEEADKLAKEAGKNPTTIDHGYVNGN